MNDPLHRRFLDALAGSALESRLTPALHPLLEQPRPRAALDALEPPMLRGIARAIASQPETAVFLSHRPRLLERLAHARGGALSRRTAELAAWDFEDGGADLEGALDALRLLRREESCWAACIHHAGIASFPEVSEFLSILAETIAQRALALARRVAPDLEFAVLGMGTVAGREFSWHSDLDLVFLYEGTPEQVDAASRVAQRMVSYLTTMTGAGVAYAVDTRLRPSGGQGMLVTSLSAFERYQCDKAQTWEHLALLRARPIAGALPAARELLARVRARVLAAHGPPWEELVSLRERVEIERARATPDKIAFKTGPGGLMDVDFLAGGGVLERGPERLPELPSIPALLEAAASGPRVSALIEDFAFLRRVEASARWIAGRAVESLSADPESLEVAAELTEPGLRGPELRERIGVCRRSIRASYQRVIREGSIAALES